MDEKRYQKYRDYLKSREWSAIRADMITVRGEACEVCGSSHHLQVHHLTYDNLFFEEPEDLVLLCAKCHTKVHGIVNKKKHTRTKNPKKRSRRKQKYLDREISRMIRAQKRLLRYREKVRAAENYLNKTKEATKAYMLSNKK